MSAPEHGRGHPSLEALASINDDGSRNFIYPADVSGRFTTLRTITGWVLIGVYALLPWVPVNGNPAVLLDVTKGQYHFFGLTFVSQDVWLAFFLLSGAGFALFFATALWGRVWCGWACPQTVFLEHIYRRIERWIEGDALARRRLAAAPWTPRKATLQAVKWLLYLVVSVAITHIFLSYFISLPELFQMVRGSPARHWSLFLFATITTGTLLFNFAWFREQFCIILCPYGRLQSVLVDDDSVVIGYDARRGEPRGRVGTAGAGDCIDCQRCVHVCPTGIDIRQGLQMECVSCSNCIDACDAIMRKVGRAVGLIRYDSVNALMGRPTRILRPRIVLYIVFAAVGMIGALIAFSGFRSTTVSALRMTGAPFYVADGMVRNQFLIRIVNKENRARTFSVTATAAGQSMRQSGLDKPVAIEPLEEDLAPLILSVPQGEFRGGFQVDIVIRDTTGRFQTTKKLPFLGPGPAGTSR